MYDSNDWEEGTNSVAADVQVQGCSATWIVDAVRVRLDLGIIGDQWHIATHRLHLTTWAAGEAGSIPAWFHEQVNWRI